MLYHGLLSEFLLSRNSVQHVVELLPGQSTIEAKVPEDFLWQHYCEMLLFNSALCENMGAYEVH